MNYPPPTICSICGYEYETPREGICDGCGAPLKLVPILARTEKFKPRDFAEMLDKERVWTEFLLRLIHQRASCPKVDENDIATGMLRDRARWLRN
jgi:hypothetical protein